MSDKSLISIQWIDSDDGRERREETVRGGYILGPEVITEDIARQAGGTNDSETTSSSSHY